MTMLRGIETLGKRADLKEENHTNTHKKDFSNQFSSFTSPFMLSSYNTPPPLFVNAVYD